MNGVDRATKYLLKTWARLGSTVDDEVMPRSGFELVISHAVGSMATVPDRLNVSNEPINDA